MYLSHKLRSNASPLMHCVNASAIVNAQPRSWRRKLNAQKRWRRTKLSVWQKPSVIVNCAEKVVEEEAQRAAKAVAKAAERDAKWSAEVDSSIESMINGGVSFKKIASKLGNGLKENDIKNRWYTKLKKSSSIIKPAVQSGFPSRITWTEDVDATIVRMRTDGDSFPKIASELGNGLAIHAIMNRWNRHLKDKLI